MDRSYTRCVRKVMRLIFYLPFFSNINLIPFKTVPWGSYTPMEEFPLLVAALEVFSRHGLQHVRYTRKNRIIWKHLTDAALIAFRLVVFLSNHLVSLGEALFAHRQIAVHCIDRSVELMKLVPPINCTVITRVHS